MDIIVKWLVAGFFWLLGLLPYRVRVCVVTYLLRAFALFVPSMKSVSLTNLRMAFPEQSEEWCKQILERSFVSLAQAIVDFGRLRSLDQRWVKNNVKIDYWKRYLELKSRSPKRPILIATGHLGSFELQGFLLGLLGHPISFVVRNFKLPALDKWWNSIRELHGNAVISRKGAFKEMLNHLKQGRDVAVLFDQNVQRKHAIFVPWFGKAAATTRALGLVALRTNAIILVTSLSSLDDGSYQMNVSECDFEELYNNASLCDDEKLLMITEKVVSEYEKLIRKDPHAWFWMHRRWRTRPEGEHAIY